MVVEIPNSLAPLRAIFPNDFSFFVFVASTFSFTSIFYAALLSGVGKIEGKEPSKSDVNKALRARSWIITLVASLCMTLASIPFVVDLIMSKGDVMMVQRREPLADGAAALFISYLVTDLVMGCFHYRSQMSILTGWIHHISYTVLVAFILKKRFAHVFVMAAFMELPTFVLALSMLVPATRSDELFAALFFAIRIVYHIALIAIFGSSYGRTHGTARYNLAGAPMGSLVPLCSLLAAAPLHISWFTSSTQGMLKRRARKQAEARAANSPQSPFLLPARPRLSSLPSFSLPRPAFLTNRRNLQRSNPIERTVRDYFRLPVELRLPSSPEARGDFIKAIDPTPTLANLRMRAGRSGEEMRRFGGRIRRRVVGSPAPAATPAAPVVA